ncbi:unnamed protein product [Auanema sp. JU1783]|nr:unnamed protein product [Auanema sp. JU1783]
MNPITNIKNQNRLNERELNLGIAGDLGKSWHQKYNDSAWVYIGGLPFDLTEGDIITVFSQYGEVMNINLIRDRKTGKSKGFCFLCYQDQRSTVLAVDNMNGIMLLKRMLRVDHVEEYKVPKYREDADEETKRLWEEGCAPKPIQREAIIEPIKDEPQISYTKDVILDLKVDDYTKDIKKQMKKDKKNAKKEKKKAKKDKKKMEKVRKLLEKSKNDPEGNWKEQMKLLDVKVDDDELYKNEHFNFGKKIEKEEKVYNARPDDFNKLTETERAIWKIVRDQEIAEKGKGVWKEGENYVSKRYR